MLRAIPANAGWVQHTNYLVLRAIPANAGWVEHTNYLVLRAIPANAGEALQSAYSAAQSSNPNSSTQLLDSEYRRQKSLSISGRFLISIKRIATAKMNFWRDYDKSKSTATLSGGAKLDSMHLTDWKIYTKPHDCRAFPPFGNGFVACPVGVPLPQGFC